MNAIAHRIIALIALLTLTVTTGCIAPAGVVQDATLVEKGAVDTTVYASAVKAGEMVDVAARASVGVADGVNVQVGGGTQLGGGRPRGGWAEVGGKFSLIEDHLALYAPVGVGRSTEGWAFGAAPTLIGSLHVSPSFSINPFAKVMFGVHDGEAVDPFGVVGASATIELGEHVALLPELSATRIKADGFGDVVPVASLGVRVGF